MLPDWLPLHRLAIPVAFAAALVAVVHVAVLLPVDAPLERAVGLRSSGQ